MLIRTSLLLCIFFLAACEQVGTLRVVNDMEGSTVLINDEPVGTIRIGYKSLQVPAGNHKIEISKISADGEWRSHATKVVYVPADEIIVADLRTTKTPTQKRLDRLAALVAEAERQTKLAAEAKAKQQKLDRLSGTTVASNGLMWTRCALGLRWTGNRCEGESEKLSLKSANKYVSEMNRDEGFAGFQDWRLPTLEELNTLILCSQRSDVDEWLRGKTCSNPDEPAYDTEAFPNSHKASYLSSTYYRGSTYIFLNNGYNGHGYSYERYSVLLVRGESNN